MNSIKKIVKIIEVNYYSIIFLMTAVGFFGSLYFSEVLQLEPCYLCWWQRIFLYPIFILVATKIIFKKTLDKLFILILSLIGNAFAIYHVLVQEFGLGKQFLNCAADNPCDVIDLELFGFLTIPIMSLIAFSTMTLITIFVIYREKKQARAEAV